MESNIVHAIPESIKNPDLIMEIKASPQQLEDFGIEVDGSKIIRKGKPGKIEGDIGTFTIPTVTFDLSRNNSEAVGRPVRNEGELKNNHTILTWAVQRSIDSNLYRFPDATHVSLIYHTPKTKIRKHMLAEYMGDYFELVITDKDGSKKTYHLEHNLEIH
jgi:hypothetical protein